MNQKSLTILFIFPIILHYFPVTSMSLDLNLLIKYFNGCHFKFLYSASGTFLERSSLTQATINQIMVSNWVTFSIETKGTLKNHHHPTRFSTCFILGYVDFFDNINNPNSLASTDVESVLHKMPIAEKLSHLIVFVNWQHKTRYNLPWKASEFFKLLLPTTFMTGMALLVDSSQQISLVCITCSNTFHKLTIFQTKKPFQIQFTWNSLHYNLNKVPISSILTNSDIYQSNPHQCDKLITKASQMIYIPTPLTCTYKILERKQNFSLVSNEDAIGTLFYLPLSPTNLQLLENDGINDFISYGMTVTSFSFIVVKNSPKYKWAPLKPFETTCWIFFLLTAFAMLILSKNSSGTWNTNLFSLVASILDQGLYLGSGLSRYNFHNIVWIIMILILNGAYKGIMFSNITNEPKLDWPKALTEFLLLPCNKVTISSLYSFQGTEYIVSNSIFHETFKQNTSNLSSNEYSNLEESVIHLSEHEAGLELVYEALTPPTDEITMKLNTSEFGIVDQETTTLRIRHAFNVFGRDKAISHPERIDKFTLPSIWISQNNLLHPMFKNGLGHFRVGKKHG
ncbi:unnamed protein product [Orchesella dallaii]|uniref:Uncharacterized protein n=1 Tax=Orchesella dallaii TaxID=48710 RepID=A0ABP1RHU5_9HEXA